MNLPPIVLASKSPRRLELLRLLGVAEPLILPAAEEAPVPSALPPEEAVLRIALAKARDVRPRAPEGSLILAADTIVVLEGQVMGKPRDEEDAFRMLRALSGRAHTVYTAVCLLYGAQELCRRVDTQVFFRPLSDGEIRRYIATGEPMDKAGAYGAQGLASLFIERMEGDFFNVVGLPLCAVGEMLNSLGFSLL